MRLLVFLFLLLPAFAMCQVVTTDPVFPVASQPMTITVDVSGTSLDHFAWNNDTNPVYIWTWIRKTGSPDIDAPTNVNPATAAQAAAKCTRISVNPDKYQITFTPTVFFNKTAAEIPRIGLKLKSKDWNENKQTDVDKFIDFVTGLNLSFTSPTGTMIFKNTSDQFPITVAASEPSTLTLKINGATVATTTGATSLTYDHTVTETGGTTLVVCEAVSGSNTKTVSFTYTIRTPVVQETRPTAIRDGINYPVDNSRATLSLWAPGKTSVYIIGDFTNWAPDAAYQMKQDGEHFWLELTGLTPGTEYGFQYLVDETIRVADPFADKILDPDDQFIPASTYPNLKPFPSKAISDKWYFNRVAILQTNQAAYPWKNLNYNKPAKEKLVIYELHIRDFFGANARNYKSLIDTLTYLKRLGVNAIELMPVTEFNGNDSWGYNPAFMFAPDKYYGTKNRLKELVDACHEKGIAVILDMVMNHHDVPNPFVMLDFDFNAFKPTASNKWFNVDAKHPFNVFFDMNHESAYTKKYLDTVNYYWLKEFRIDGLRFDLSKGFTQTNNPGNVEAWSASDASRIAILKRMADKIWAHTPDAYVILEHFADNAEEKELAEYRAGEGKGMMLWSNFNYGYNQCTMGYTDGTDVSGIYYPNRSWTVPHNIGYMESHDEERLVYKNKQFGNAAGAYSVKSTPPALDRVKAAMAVFLTVPGPKMIWQFGELGYDLSINTCSNGTVNSDCRTAAKPVKWDYLQDGNRRSIFNITADLIRLRSAHTVFTSGTATLTPGNSLVRQVVLKNNPYTASPASEAQMNVVVVANFDVVNQNALASFPHTGTWFDYYAMGASLNVGSAIQGITLMPGEFKIYTDVKIENPTYALITGLEDTPGPVVEIYPNPAGSVISVHPPQWEGGRGEAENPVHSITLVSVDGSRRKLTQIDSHSWDISGFPPGLYVAQLEVNNTCVTRKIIKH